MISHWNHVWQIKKKIYFRSKMYKMYAPPLLSIHRNSFHGATTLSIYQMTLSMSTVRSESFVYLCMLLLSTGLNEVPFRYGAAYFDSIFVPSLGYLQVLNGSTNVYFWNQNPGSSYKSCSNTHFRQRWLTADDMCAAGYHDPYDCNSGMGRAVMQSVAYLQEPSLPHTKTYGWESCHMCWRFLLWLANLECFRMAGWTELNIVGGCSDLPLGMWTLRQLSVRNDGRACSFLLVFSWIKMSIEFVFFVRFLDLNKSV